MTRADRITRKQAARRRARPRALAGVRDSLAAIACVVLLAAGAAAVPARASEWAPFGLQGVDIRSLAAAPDLLCAGSAGNGVYCRDLRATGTGAAWTALGPASTTITWLWIDPLAPERRFAAAGTAVSTPTLYRTLDAGKSWTAIDHFPNPGGPTPRAWAVHGVPGGALWAAGWTVWVSDTLGDTWTVASGFSGLDCLEVSPQDPLEVWSGGETVIFSGFTIRTLNGGASWESVWDSRGIGDNQTADVAVHPGQEGLVLSGHEGFVLRSEDHGVTWARVLTAPSRFFLDWDGAAPDNAYAAGSPNGGTAHAFASRDAGRTWTDITGTVLAPRFVFRLAADANRTGVVYVATETGIFRHYGGGTPICLDARDGLEAIRIGQGPCAAAPAGTWAPVPGDAIAVDLDKVHSAGGHIDLGEVECLMSQSDLGLVTLDTPDPAPGRAIAILARSPGAADYGSSSSGTPRRPSLGDCP